MSDTDFPANFTASSIVNSSFAANAIRYEDITRLADQKPYRGTVADALVYGKAETLSEAVAYHRHKLSEAFDNRWHTEVRETYRLEPKWAAWKMAMIACAFSLAANLAIATYRHEVNPQNIESMGLGLAIAFCGICTWVSIWRKFVPNW